MRAGLAELSNDIHQAIAEGVIPQLDVEFLTASLGGVAFSILDEMMEREPLDPKRSAICDAAFHDGCARQRKLTCLGGHYEHSKTDTFGHPRSYRAHWSAKWQDHRLK